MRRRGRRGAVLLEVLVALAVLAAGGLALVALVQGALADAARAKRMEAEAAAASRVLTALTLLTRGELDQRLGAHPLGEFVVEIQRPERSLYRVTVAPRTAPGQPLLVTVVHRP